MITISGLLMVVADSNFLGSMMLTPTPKERVSSLRLSILTQNMWYMRYPLCRESTPYARYIILTIFPVKKNPFLI